MAQTTMSPTLDVNPVAFPHPIYLNTYSFGLSILYMIILVVVLFQIIRILCFKHNLLHYQFFFLAFCLAWSILRTVFWLVTPWSAGWENVLQILSIWAQFAMFAFLALWLLQVVYKTEGWWSTYRVRVFTIYTATILVCFFGYLTILVLSLEFGSNSDIINYCSLSLVATMFNLLSALIIYYTYKMWSLKSNIKPQLPPNRTKLHILIMSIILCLIFVSRAIKAIIAIFGVGLISFHSPSETGIGLQVALFFMYFGWEVLPTSFVILLFWHIPRTQRALWGKFNTPGLASDIPNIAYDSDLRKGAINDGSTTDDSIIVSWDPNRSSSIFTSEVPHHIEEEDVDPSTPVLAYPGSYAGDTRYTPYNIRSPLLQSHR